MTSTFQTALTTPNYTSLRGSTGNNPWWAHQFITLCKNTHVFAARVNGAISSSSFAQITFDTMTTGAYTDIEIGETFFLSHTSDIRAAYYRGRIRKAATSTLLKVNETSVNITDNDYIFVVYDFDVWDVLSRMVSSTQYEDYDIAYQKLPPVTAGLQTAYVNYDPADGAYRIAFNVGSSYSTDEYSTRTLTYQFTFVAGTYTVVSGALNTSAVTVDFNANTEQWGKLVITDSQGTTWTRRFYIRAMGSTDTPDFNFSGAQITGSVDNGWNAQVSAWAGVQNVLNQTFCVIWTQEYYNGTPGPIFNNIDMVGRFHRETNTGRGDPLYSYIADVKFDIEGVCTQMQRLQEQDLTTIDKGVAAKWDEISFNTPQRSIVHYLARHSTVLSLCDLTFPNGFDLTYLFQYVPNQGGNVLDAIKGIAKQFNANVEFAPDGRIQVVRDTRFLSDKSGVVIVGNFDNRDFTAIESLGVDPVNETGRLDAYGASYNAGVLLTDRSRAPGSAQSYAAGQSSLDAQILAATSNQAAAQTELNYRAGQQMAIENLTYSQGWRAAHGGYHFLIPSRGQRVTHLLTTATNVRGLSFGTSDYWQVISVSITHNNTDGSRTVTTQEELEPPVGDSGDTVPQIAGGTQTNPILLQPLDPFPSLPDDPGDYLSDNPTPNPYPPIIPLQNGNTVIYTDGSIGDTSRDVMASRTPVWIGATPTDLGAFQIRDITFDRTSLKPPYGAYLVASDGTNSAFWYTADGFAIPAKWTKGATFAGIYTQIRSAGTAGSALVSTFDDAGSITSYDLTLNNQGFTHANPPRAGVYVTGTGWTTADYQASGGEWRREIWVGIGFSSALITSIKVTYTLQLGNSDAPSEGAVAINYGTGPGTPLAYIPESDAHSGTDLVFSWNGSLTTNGLSFELISDRNASSASGFTGSGILTEIEITFSNAGAASIRYSSDYGSTVSSSINVGTSPGGAAGFDLEPIGGTSLASAAGQVKIATSPGGSYSNAAGGTLSSGNPTTLVVPYRRWPNGATQYSASNPDYLLIGSAAISGASVWKVDGASGTKTDITPSGAVGVGPNLATVWQSGSVCKLAIIVNVSGVYKLYTSLNAGSSWTFRRNVLNPIYLRCRRNDLYGKQLYLIDGNTLYVSPDWGITWLADTTPSGSLGVAMDMIN